MSHLETNTASDLDEHQQKWCMGVPYKESRELSPEERLSLLGQLKRSSKLLLLMIGCSICTYLLSSKVGFNFEIVLFIFFTMSAFVACVLMALVWLPLLRSVQQNKVLVFEGEMLTPWTSDTIASSFQRQYEIEPGSNARIEVLGGCLLQAVNGRTACHSSSLFKGISSLFPVRCRVFRIELREENSTKLSSQERGELRKQILRSFGGCIGQCFVLLLVLPMIYGVYHTWSQRGQLPFIGWIWGIASLFTAIAYASEILRYLGNLPRLILDLCIPHLVRDEEKNATHLRFSKTYWTVQNRPASWRVSKTFWWKPPVNIPPSG